MGYKTKKILLSLLLLFIVIAVFLMFLCNIPIDKDNSSLEKILLSSIPTYVMLYASLQIHLLSYVKNSTVLFILDDPIYNGWEINFKLKVHNYTDKSIELKRIESTDLGLYNFEQPDNIADKNNNNIFRVTMRLNRDILDIERKEFISAEVVYSESNKRHFLKIANKWGNSKNEKI